jgi:hypothetical protein
MIGIAGDASRHGGKPEARNQKAEGKSEIRTTKTETSRRHRSAASSLSFGPSAFGFLFSLLVSSFWITCPRCDRPTFSNDACRDPNHAPRTATSHHRRSAGWGSERMCRAETLRRREQGKAEASRISLRLGVSARPICLFLNSGHPCSPRDPEPIEINPNWHRDFGSHGRPMLSNLASTFGESCRPRHFSP